ncbi:hypothetical protein FIU86_13040 [Roseovarius sp. THAF9]|uniref:hypothetical protein n=1 Tax=Roseovarius sp. THAF9 TaxID=2587847 RepID=UPI0012A816A3|nr:hypothetical protein [Roseovarius sp. THAF9]QFT93770.1 hypothetical protein FIU86_13040 [Roseovarius sp. THAF9]
MRVMPHPESAGQEPRQKLIPEPRSFTLLDAAMTSGLCLDLMLERLLQTAGEPGA